ncbi:MAG: hypothetical protein ACRYFK_12895 [Janthinobacterium lividum]
MRLFLLAVLCLSWSAGWAIQTTPTTSAPAAGTKNVGRDRADAPQAPGMTKPTADSMPTTRRATRKTHSPGKAARPQKM